jgi:hypothetical protein
MEELKQENERRGAELKGVGESKQGGSKSSADSDEDEKKRKKLDAERRALDEQGRKLTEEKERLDRERQTASTIGSGATSTSRPWAI